MGVGREMPQPRTARIVIGDIAGPHRQQRPPCARIADTAAVSVHVVGRGGVFRMILRIPLVGTPFRFPLTERIVDIAALVVSVDLIGECGGDKYQRRSHYTGSW